MLKHFALLIIMPIAMAALVFFITSKQSKTYTSSSLIYTGIASGSSITSLESAKRDLFGTNTAFDNLITIIKERNTIEEIGLRLFVSHLLSGGSNIEKISKNKYQELMEIVPDEVKELAVRNDFDKTLENIKAYRDKDYTNFIYELINYEHPDYSIKKISSKLKVSRVKSSDLIEISYESDDPGICKNTLEILNEVFIKKYSFIQANQSDAVVQYFKGQLENAIIKLDEAENELLEFNQTNTIINYNEQTKHIASEKEHFDLTYMDIKMKNVAAKSVLQVLEAKMSPLEKQKINNEKILNLRNKLSDLNIEIALKTYEAKKDSSLEQGLIERITELKKEENDTQQELRDAVKEQYLFDNTTEGVPSTTIIEDWIDKTIEYEATKAQLLLGEMQKKEYDQLFIDYAPLGATMKRLERKISVAEREYLSILHSFDLAKLNQQNIELNSNLKILVEPLFPINPEPSKRKYLVIIAFMIGFIIPASVIILLEFLDQSIGTAKRAEELMGLSLAAIYPNLSKINKNIDIESLKNKGNNIIVRRLILNSEKREHKKPEINLFFSIQSGEGKTMIATMLLNELAKSGYKVLLLSHNKIDDVKNFDIYTYNTNKAFQHIETSNEFINNCVSENFDVNQYDYIFFEIPGLIDHTYPIKLFKNVNQTYIIVRANRAWTNSDKYALKDVIEATKENEPQIILNGVKVEEMENVLGDLPRKRSFFRKLIKNTLRFHFYSR